MNCASQVLAAPNLMVIGEASRNRLCGWVLSLARHWTICCSGSKIIDLLQAANATNFGRAAYFE